MFFASHPGGIISNISIRKNRTWARWGQLYCCGLLTPQFNYRTTQHTYSAFDVVYLEHIKASGILVHERVIEYEAIIMSGRQLMDHDSRFCRYHCQRGHCLPPSRHPHPRHHLWYSSIIQQSSEERDNLKSQNHGLNWRHHTKQHQKFYGTRASSSSPPIDTVIKIATCSFETPSLQNQMNIINKQKQ